jgi:hypothetical protein
MEEAEMLRLLLLVAATLLLLPPPSAQAQPGERCFAETGFCISGAIRAYWERNGGVAVFGYPVTDQRVATVEGSWTGPVQWFERDRLEDHSAEGRGVQAGRLGARWLELTGRPWQTLFPPEPLTPPACQHFPQTGFNLCEPFLSYWRANGGLDRFGYPLTPTFEETILFDVGSNVPGSWTGTVQYFERRRMEYHPEHAGTPHAVLLGLLGRDTFEREHSAAGCPAVSPLLQGTWARYAWDLGCPWPFGDGRIATQLFERGEMVWVGQSGGGPSQIFVIVGNQVAGATWQVYPDTYVEGEPVGTAELPPPGKFAPARGFGKLWRQNAEVRRALGWALFPEQGDSGATATLSHRDGVSWMIHRAGPDMVFILRGVAAPGQALDLPRVP